MNRLITLIALLACMSLSAHAERILADLDFSQGEWTLAGLASEEHEIFASDEFMGPFVSTSSGLLMELQTSWDLPMVFFDSYSHHYELSLYENGQLRRKLLLNLIDQYVLIDGLSYELSASALHLLRSDTNPVKTGTVGFKDLVSLQEALDKTSLQENVFWYEDIHPYKFDGYLFIQKAGIPLLKDEDEVMRAIQQSLNTSIGEGKYYLKEYFTTTHGKKKHMRFFVYCNAEADELPIEGKYIRWRSHFVDTDKIKLTILGKDQEGLEALLEEAEYDQHLYRDRD